MPLLNRILRFIDDMNDNAGKFVSFSVLILVGILCWEVFLRYFFNSPTIWVHESTQYFFGAHFMIGGAYALRHKAMVNVNILYERFSLRVRAIIDIITSTIFFLFIGVLLWKGTDLAIISISRNEMSQSPWGPPVYPIKIVLVIGVFLVMLQGMAKLIRDVATAISGREAL